MFYYTFAFTKNQEFAKAYIFKKTYEITQLKEEKMARTQKLVTEFNQLTKNQEVRQMYKFAFPWGLNEVIQLFIVSGSENC